MPLRLSNNRLIGAKLWRYEYESLSRLRPLGQIAYA